MTTEELLLKHYGSPLLTLQQVAQLLNRSPDGLRITLAGNNDVARKLRPARRKIGRRVLFSVAELSRFIDQTTA
ncbi:helix-turn-helix domain-containing protein [Advenella kashmirensis]|uniref:helix-turn-helix domain-containing protein n=1 Tax=Advenella kashmirensis TaxID=310575 RepID=UPI0009D9A6DC|nr:helix-turn-helix domain-containing protein [Advenella kashmirensis]